MYDDFNTQNTETAFHVTEQKEPCEADSSAQIHDNSSHSKRTKQKRFAAKVAAFGLCCAILGGGVGGIGGALLSGGRKSTTTLYSGTRPTVVLNANVDGKEILSASEVYEANLKSVVGINGNVTTNIWGQTVSNAVSGSGFVISSDGYVLTNYHVIKGVSNITVFFSDGTSYDAEVVGGEEDNDIAVLKINATDLQPAVLGNSSSIEVGENVYAIGNPLGELTFTLTGGLVSAKDRSVTTSDGTVMNMIQTDTAINSGNSGGPLFDQYGQVIGIVSAKLSNSSSSSSTVEGLGFAIPINDVKDMVTSIIQNGYVTGKPNLGIIMGNVNSFGFSKNSDSIGCQVLAVLDNSCADQSGLQVGDIITGVDGTEITSGSELSAEIRKHKSGDQISLTVLRNGKTSELSVILDEDSKERQTAMTQLQNQYQASQQMDSYYGDYPYENKN